MLTVATLAMNLGKRHSQAAHSREYFSFAEGSKSEHQRAALNRHRVSSTMTKRSMVRTFFDSLK
jgi:hypothetical protein